MIPGPTREFLVWRGVRERTYEETMAAVNGAVVILTAKGRAALES